MHTYLAVVDDKTAVMAYVGVENLKRAVAAAKATGGGLAADPQIAETTTLLPKGAQWLSYIHPQGLVEFVGSLLSMSAAPGGPAHSSQHTRLAADRDRRQVLGRRFECRHRGTGRHAASYRPGRGDGAGCNRRPGRFTRRDSARLLMSTGLPRYQMASVGR